MVIAGARRIGVLSLQGAVSEHIEAAGRAGCSGFAVKNGKDLETADALIIPGGESTAIARLIRKQGLEEDIRSFARVRPLLGTCAGLILCAKELVACADPAPLGIMDVKVERNGFGRQKDSFETDLEVEGIGTVRAVFIRAPFIHAAGPGVRVLARFEGKIVMAEQGKTLVTAFHPELTDDGRIFSYLAGKIQGTG
ncbi:MAG: pyridoxal 5'-phosphate synthase glutaminase subunit PdxT [Desulfovibrio sp.]|jgi:5'-phosphate synthase pdxT subunit|nr:pyridoxal 5'-phosphate synthase glutaminase subunit PdxT [Desulfovibrio sp.]